MPQLLVISGDKAVRVFESFGWSIARQRGSHIILIKNGHIATLSVPNHKEISVGTLRALLRTANISVQEFLDAIK